MHRRLISTVPAIIITFYNTTSKVQQVRFFPSSAIPMTTLLDYDPVDLIPLRRVYDLDRLRNLLAEYCVSIGEGGNYSVAPWEFKAVIELEGDLPPKTYPF